jgi:hypothetical protein
VTDDAETLDGMMEPFEARGFKLIEPLRNDTTPSSDSLVEAIVEVHIEAVRQEMSPSKGLGVRNQLLQIEPEGSVICGDHSARADADDGMNRNTVTHELAKYTDMSGATQATRAEHDSNTNLFRNAIHG